MLFRSDPLAADAVIAVGHRVHQHLPQHLPGVFALLRPLQVAQAPRMHVEAAEPVSVTESLNEGVVNELRAMGHEVEVVKGVAGAMHAAELRRGGREVCAGGNHWAAGVE